MNGRPGGPGVAAPALVGRGRQCAAGDVCGFPGNMPVGETLTSIAYAGSLNAPLVPCPSGSCSVPSTTTGLFWVTRPTTSGYPSMETAGCDGVLGSGTHEDNCGQCGGRNSSCLFIQRIFSEAAPPSGQSYGYWNVTLIPIGARHIRVTDRSRNYLALMGSDGRYVFNGDWAIDWPGTFQVSGTQVHYSRANDRDESLWAPGPTGEDLHLQVLFQEPNPGIEFEFWLPRDAYYALQSHRSPLRQPQTREVEVGPGPQEAAPAWTRPAPSSPGFSPPRGQLIETETCKPCPGAKGRSQRLLHYCRSDFVFRARVLARLHMGEETRYDIQVQHSYKNWTPLERREFLWAPGACPCPLLVPRAEYLVAAQRHINYEGTLDRLLLPYAGYARPWTPREDTRIQEVAKQCPQAPPAG
ncbi:ADAMTS-like protein 5 isoform X6 [Petaurus breviceps papuanus]|uniref:ADAMTS-like protein 5 isoform X6 n=1 Tax=Petaurus breviceps papuanus TaxID=3040969 RepID=UPI0036DB1B44